MSGQIIFDANDPGDKDSFPLGANPPKPPVPVATILASDAATATGPVLGAATRGAGTSQIITFASGDPVALDIRAGDTLQVLTASGGSTGGLVGDHVITAVTTSTVTLATTFVGTDDVNADTFEVERRFRTLDNVVFSNVHKKPALRPSPANDRRNIYMRIPGLLGRSIRPRRSIRLSDAEFTDLSSAAGSLPFTRRTTGAAGSTGGAVTALGRTFTSDAADTLQTDGVVAGDVLILSDAGGSNGRYVVTSVPTETTAVVDRPFPATDADVSYSIITPNGFVDAVNRLIDVGALEVRNNAGTLVAPVLPTA